MVQFGFLGEVPIVDDLDKKQRFRIRPARILLILALAGFFLLMPMPTHGRIGIAVADLLHAPCFAVLAAVVYRLINPRTDKQKWPVAGGVWVSLVMFGLGAELAQNMTGRSASLQDAFANVVGITAGLLWAVTHQSTRAGERWVLRSVGTLLMVAGLMYPALVLFDVYLARRSFPQLASFEQPLEFMRLKPNGARLRRVRDHATDGSWALRVDLLDGDYPGVETHLAGGDWALYDELVMDVVWDEAEHDPGEGQLLTIVVKVEDEQHIYEYEDCFHQAVELQPGRPQQIRISLDEVSAAPLGRMMTMDEIRKVEVFARHLDRRQTLYLDNLRLE